MSQHRRTATEPQASRDTATCQERHSRRHSIQQSARGVPIHTRVARLFSSDAARGLADAHDDSSDGEEDENDKREGRGNFLARATSYSRLMHAHTKGQLDRPSVGTLPSYTRTMHAFTLNQLNHTENTQGTTKSLSSSPQAGAAKTAFLQNRLATELNRMTLDEEPHGPVNTPEIPRAMPNELAVALPLQPSRRRSVTEPVPREFMASKAIDFATTAATLVN